MLMKVFLETKLLLWPFYELYGLLLQTQAYKMILIIKFFFAVFEIFRLFSLRGQVISFKVW